MDLKKGNSLLKFAEITLTHQGGLLKKVAHNPKYKHLLLTKMKRAFQRTTRRVIVVDFHTLLVNAIQVVDVGATRTSEYIK